MLHPILSRIGVPYTVKHNHCPHFRGSSPFFIILAHISMSKQENLVTWDKNRKWEEVYSFSLFDTMLERL